jgi:deoxyribodipyrimidine photo-lyase
MTATRAAGLARLEEFSARMGRDYAQGRNFDRGLGAHRDVSMLSAYIRRRLITEQEVIATAIKAQGAEASAKFIDEVIWRSYFKGWLEQRPEIWDSYAGGLRQDLAELDADAGLRHAVQAAETAQTGLAYFDSWAAELVETGYLHNHARMWFASIWIFTLKLPWRLGADFFLRNLLDGDPASNTLSWRWVAGLHTRGKPYVAQADNIARFTEERFVPRRQELTQGAVGLEALEPDGLPECQAPRVPIAPQKHIPTALLLTEEDCRIEDFPVQDLICTTVATLAASSCARRVRPRLLWRSLRRRLWLM